MQRARTAAAPAGGDPVMMLDGSGPAAYAHHFRGDAS
jgi:hypothetical protein